MQHDLRRELTQTEADNLRRLAGLMVPASSVYRVPGADDPVIFEDICRSLGRDLPLVRKALIQLNEDAGGHFGGLPEPEAKAVAAQFLARQGSEMIALGRSVLQCYYRDDRVIVALGLEPRAPFPKGHSLPPSDWTLLDPVRGRPPMWRDVDRKGV